MRLSRHRIISSIVLFFVIIGGFVFSSYAWLDYTYGINNDVIGRAKVGLRSYFGGGTGIDTSPFIIAEEEHFYNLSILQNLGYLQSTTYYFKVIPANSSVKYIDFSTYHSIPPIGTHIYPFKGFFDGDYSNLKYLTIDGSGMQDIGVFGNIGTGGQVKNLFLEEPEIISNPVSNLNMTNFHVHNNDIKNIATGYIVGHLGTPPDETFVSLSNVFVIAPKITSLSNNNLNRSQFGLIGFNASDLGVITGGPRDAYNFSLNANNAYINLAYAIRDFGSWLVYGSNVALNTILYGTTVDALGNVTGTVIMHPTYSLSTIRIYQSGFDPSTAVYLYDKMVISGYIITGANNTKYSRENVDIVGRSISTSLPTIDSTYMYFDAQGTVNSLAISSQYTPTAYPNTLILYVKPPVTTGGNLGKASLVSISGGGKLGIYRSFIVDVNATIGFSYTYPKSFSVRKDYEPFVGAGVLNLTIADAFCAVTRNETTGVMTVVDPNNANTPPDFYVIMLTISNSNGVGLTEVNFEFIPSVLTQDVLTSIEKVDFINSITDVTGLASVDNYTFSYFNFGYDLTANQKFDVFTVRQADGSFNVYLNYDITDYSTFYFDIININNYSVNIYINGSSTPYTSTNDVIEAIFERNISGSTVTYKSYNTT